jgi:hypothetical protein
MPDSNKINKIREKIREWMQEPVSDEDEDYGKKLQDDIRQFWPELFADTPGRPVTNRDVLTIANMYLSEAAHFVKQYNNEDFLKENGEFVEKHAALAHTTPRKILRLYEDTEKCEKNMRALEASMVALASSEELSFADTELHMRNAARGMQVFSLADEVVTGKRPMHQFVDSQPERSVLMDAIDHASINYDAMELRKIIEGRGRGLSDGEDPKAA